MAGKPMTQERISAWAVERFWARVLKTETCWLWQGPRCKGGYAQLSVGGRKIYVHRFSWSLVHGPTELDVLHHCDVPACVRPEHLFSGTHFDNMLDAKTKGRFVNQKKTHCRKGHPLEGENVRINMSERVCRQCNRDKTQRYREHRRIAVD
jgi:hypothetical protein